MSTNNGNSKKRKRHQETESPAAFPKHPQRSFVSNNKLTNEQRLVLGVLAVAAHGLQVDQLEQVDRKKYHIIFECCVALSLDMMLWSQLPPRVLEERHALRWSGKFPDYGIDCASSNLDRCAQAKWYKAGSSVKFRSIGTFHLYASVLGIPNLTLSVSQGVHIPELLNRSAFTGIRLDQGITNEQIKAYILRARAFVNDGQCGTGPALCSTEQQLTLRPYQVTIVDKLFTRVIDINSIINKQEMKCCTLSSTQSTPMDDDTQAQDVNKEQEDREDKDDSSDTSRNVLRVLMACGTGKTVVVANFLLKLLQYVRDNQQQLPPPRVAILVPSLLLLEQTCKCLASWAPGLTVGQVGDHICQTGDTQVIVCTYNSAKKLAALQFVAVIVDEAHRLERNHPDQTYASAIRKLQTSVFVHCSASLREEEYDCEDDDDDRALGVDFKYGLEQGITDGYLCDYNLVIPVFDKSDNLQPAIVSMVQNHPEWTHVLAYCNSRVSAQAFAALCNSNQMPASYFDGRTPTHERQRIVREFQEGKWRVLVTVNTLSEGIDIPEANTCLFVEPRGSPVSIQQCVGRVLRLCPHLGKRLAYVILPSADEEKDLSRFLRQMTFHDSRIRHAIQNKRRGRVEILIQRAVDQQQAELISIRVYQQMSTSIARHHWQSKLELLKEFVGRHGRIPTKNEEYTLANWCHAQRSARKGHGSCRMYPRRIALLEAIPGWKWEQEDAWTSKFALLQSFVSENKRVPTCDEEYRGVKLGSWCMMQRTAKKGTSSNKLDQQRIAQLESITEWKWTQATDAWTPKFELLKQFFETHKRMPKKKDVHQGVDLGQWCIRQRQLKKKRAMNEQRITQLETIPGWKWDATRRK